MDCTNKTNLITLRVCIICLRQDKHLLNLKDNESLEILYIQKIINEAHEAMLLTSLCTVCMSKLKEFGEFVKLCQKSYNYMKKELTKTVKKEIEIDVLEEKETISLELDADENVNQFVAKTETKDRKENECKQTTNNRGWKKVHADRLKENFSKTSRSDTLDLEGTETISLEVVPNQLNDDEDERVVAETETKVRKKNGCNQNQKSNNRGRKKIDAGRLCQHCGKEFRLPSRLREHLLIHTGEMPYQCSYCHVKIRAKHHLKLHERTHTGEKPHVCEICGKGFAQTSVLRTHMKLHTGRDESCTLCEKTFCRPSDLRVHMRSHTGEKPFKCEICSRGFLQRSHYTGHMKTHSDDRPFVCKFCGTAFKYSNPLKTHELIHLGEKPYKCKQCDYACRQSYQLSVHINKHHT